MNSYLSIKLKIFSFILTLMIVFLHAYNVNGQNYNYFIQYYISQEIARIVVPMFFLIAGYLFFINIELSFQWFFAKITKRIRTLFFPYMIWSSVYTMFFLCLQKSFHGISRKNLISDDSFEGLLRTIFLHPIPYQLWFIRDLMILVCLSPIIYWVVCRFSYAILLLMLSIWLFDRLNFILFTTQSLVFFSIGVFFSLHKGLILKTYKHYTFTIIWLLFSLLLTLLNYNHIPTNSVSRLNILVGIYSIWCFYDYLFNKYNFYRWENHWVWNMSFFIYLFHEPFLSIIKTILLRISEKNEAFGLIIYFLSPLVVIATCLFIGYNLHKRYPKTYKILTGGR